MLLTAVAVGLGWSWGKGTLEFQGKTYPVKISGLSVAEVGVTKAEASGKVYNLKSIADFDGVYARSAENERGDKVSPSSWSDDEGTELGIRDWGLGISGVGVFRIPNP